MNIPKKGPQGIGTKSRRDLAKVLLNTKGVVAASDVEEILGWSLKRAANWLGHLESKGWLARIKRGLYVPISLEAESGAPAMEEPWAIADRLYAPCYISGWSAAQYWELTDQIYESIVVVTAKRVNNKIQKVGGVQFYLKMVKEKALFGTQAYWSDRTRVWVADPSRLIVDLCNDPQLGGGIRNCADIFLAYVRSEHCSHKLLIEYGDRLGNRTLFKRMGFLVEKLAPEHTELMKMCRERLSQGYSQLDPANKGDRVVKRWRLKMPAALKQGLISHD